MRDAEKATFGGSHLDRADEIRHDDGAIDAALSKGRARALVFWQGKPLLAEGLDRVISVPPEHPVLVRHPGPRVLLGRDTAGDLILARDISDWTPPAPEAGEAASDAVGEVHPDLPAGSMFADLRHIMTRLSPRDAELAATARGLFCWHETHGFCARCGAESRMINSGWQRYCDACEARHFPRTDPVVIQLITYGDKVLLGRSPVWPKGFWSLLAGFMEPGETLEEAVRRETMEEASIPVGRVRYVASQPWPFPASLMIACAGEALSDEITIDPTELEAARWVGRAELLDAMENPRPDLVPARQGAIARAVLEAWALGWIESA